MPKESLNSGGPEGINHAGFSHSHSSRRSTMNWSRVSEVQSAVDFEDEVTGPEMGRIGRMFYSHNFEVLDGVIVMIGFAIQTLTTHAQAVNDEDTQYVCLVGNRIVLGFYWIENLCRLYGAPKAFFRSGWCMFDMFVNIISSLTEFMDRFTTIGGSAEVRFLKMGRLLRIVRLFGSFPGVFSFMLGIGRCMKTLGAASAVVFIVLNVWSIISVEFLHKLAQEVNDEEGFGTCSWCADGFSNVWLANLTWFQIITGDGWSSIGRPLVERHGWVYIIFASNIIVVVWGLLNLIVAAIVDSSIAARESDVRSGAILQEQKQEESAKYFESIIRQIDSDGSGEIEVQEVLTAYKQNKELRDILMVMGVKEKDVKKLMELFDLSGDGNIDYEEFIEGMSDMRNLVLQTTMFCMMRYVQDLRDKVKGLEQACKKTTDTVRSLGDKVASLPSSGSYTSPATLQTNATKVETLTNGGEDMSTNTANAQTDASQSTQPCSQPELENPVANRSEWQEIDVHPGWYYFGNSLPEELARLPRRLKGSTPHEALHRGALANQTNLEEAPQDEHRLNNASSPLRPISPPSVLRSAEARGTELLGFGNFCKPVLSANR